MFLFCLGPFRFGSRLKFMQSGRAVKKPGECRFVWLRVGEKKLGRSRRPGTSVIFQPKATTKEQKWNARNSFTLTRLRTWSCQMTQISNSWKKSYLHWRTEVCMFRSNEGPTLETFHNCRTPNFSILFRFVFQHCLRITVYIYFQACQFRQEVQFTMLHVWCVGWRNATPEPQIQHMGTPLQKQVVFMWSILLQLA